MLERHLSEVAIEAEEVIYVVEARPLRETIVARRPRRVWIEKRALVPIHDGVIPFPHENTRRVSISREPTPVHEIDLLFNTLERLFHTSPKKQEAVTSEAPKPQHPTTRSPRTRGRGRP